MYDLIVIGAGWAGFSAAEYAAKHGLKTALIENDALGGTCLNYGCIPTKTILNTTKLFSQIKKSQKFAINTTGALVDLPQLIKRKEEVVNKLKNGLEFLIKANKIDLIRGSAKISNPQRIEVAGQLLGTKYILIATGSKPIELPTIKFDGQKIISSREALQIVAVPKSILIIGGGVIGCEFAEIFSTLGSSVEICELTANLLPGTDKEAARKLETILKKKGVKISLSTDATKVNFENYEKVLLCVGRAPVCDCLGDMEIKKERSKILVNEYLQTNIPNIYAAGDCIGGYLLAHVASYEGRLAVKNILNANTEKADYRAAPSGIYSNPEIAAVGLSEEEARKNYGEITVKRLDFLSLGMAHVLDESEGFIKIISDKNDFIVGSVIIGPRATEIIHVLTVAIKNSLKTSQLKDTIFAHPTVSEGILETLLSGTGTI